MRNLVCAAALSVSAGAAHAATFEPLTPGALGIDSGTEIRGSITVLDPTRQERFNTVSTGAQNVERTLLDGEFKNRASLATGEVGAFLGVTPSTSFAGASTNALLFDVLSFDFGDAESGNVSYAVNYDGILSNTDDGTGSDNLVIGSTSIRIFDVTDLDSAFKVFGSEGSLGNLVGPNSVGEYDPELDEFVFENLVSSTSGGLAVIGAGLEADVLSGNFSIGGADSFIVDGSGAANLFDGTLTDTFFAEEGRIYALSLTSSVTTNGDQPSIGDLFSTSVLSLSADPGATIFSASGMLPGTDAAPDIGAVPLPASGVLLLGALALLTGGAVKRRRGAA
ncbi:hypothetical protein G5B40_07180 [Pikeienuella piscinae]|uniref:VPLPA-CTERM sorting domain-containing protein n=1 Tax=Pikeienuella piscinae TaxID=2748098 RepID=A0A7L5BU40_9RHOB|nr:hypothetical protein [Pikeienuella piscinae]QIE55255.1 hypothetical protein G5B40_07180 [Pikeienuella piscinae]